MSVVVAIFGSRNGYDIDKIRSVLLKLKKRFGDRLTVVVGDCIGVDETAYRLCKELSIDVRVFMVENNPLGYKPDLEDIFSAVRGRIPLKVKYAKRTQQVFLCAYHANGYFVGFNTSGKGSQLMISFIRESLPADELKKRMVLFD